MEACWAETADITCIHPGWGVLRGRDNVLQSWLAILANPESPKIVCRAPQVTVLGDSAVVIDFDGGGRFTSALTDADPDEVHIGMRVRMTFRNTLTAEGVHNYFWKATPIR